MPFSFPIIIHFFCSIGHDINQIYDRFVTN